MKPAEVITTEAPEDILCEIMNRLHSDGPIKQEDLEVLSYLKHFHPAVLAEKESKLMYLLGLFYKAEEPNSLLSFAYSAFSKSIFEETGYDFTPVQASIRNNIIKNKYFSFSAPTSAGKSFLFRELIKDQAGDIVIVVPSRALIAEYMLAVRETVGDQKDILILQFIDDINKKRTTRRIFIVTPERASEIFRKPERFSPSLFLYDEAQISEEKVRGVTFDAFVRRSDKIFPDAKKVFAHPFVENPKAQLSKHSFNQNAEGILYKQNTVGKVYLRYDKGKNQFECFSPFIEKPHLKKNKYLLSEDIVIKTLINNGSVLIYITKESIYTKSFQTDFEKYISTCKNITDPNALQIINEIEELIGAKDKRSEIVDLMKKGVVVHHGSIPLNVRFLIERFTNMGFARICFATSTLIQGVNMPFDIVWVENVKFSGTEEDKTLGLKNLIGRAGRNTLAKNCFDYGFVIVKSIPTFAKRLSSNSKLSEESQLEKEHLDNSDDLADFINAVKNSDINDDYNLSNTKVDRLRSEVTSNSIRVILDSLFKNDSIMTGSEYRDLSPTDKMVLKSLFAKVYEASLGRNLLEGEKAVLSAAIAILLWQIQGKSFKELLALRYSYLTNQKKQRELQKELRSGLLTENEFNNKVGDINIEHSVIPHQLPNSSLAHRPPSRFSYKKVKDFSYDLMVYDTYDFLDKVISFSLSDIYVAAFDQFYKQTSDTRARDMANYFRYGTNEETEILLLRYGFSIEEAEKIKVFIKSIDENEILFLEEINNPEHKDILILVNRYL